MKNDSKVLISLAVIAVIIVGGAITARHSKKQPTSNTPAATPTPQVATEEQKQSVIDCPDLKHLPPSSYTTTSGYCNFTDEHYTTVTQLAQSERESGDAEVSAYITKAYEKDGAVYIDTDDFTWYGQAAKNEADRCVSAQDYPNNTIPKSEKRPECNPNGFAIVNNIHTVKTYKLLDTVKIRLLEEFNTIPDLRTLTPKEFMIGKNKFGHSYYTYEGSDNEPSGPPFALILNKGQVSFIHQSYIP
jgi:hypothetical protein